MQSLQHKIPSFLLTLRQMLDNDNQGSIVWWNAGRQFIITDPSRFSQQTLPRYFKHSNLSSFIRQLNIYHFKKLSNHKDPNQYVYHHKYFTQQHPQKMCLIRRKDKDNIDVKIEQESDGNENKVKDDKFQKIDKVTNDIVIKQKKQLYDEINQLQHYLDYLQQANAKIIEQNDYLSQKLDKNHQLFSNTTKTLSQYLLNSYQQQYLTYSSIIQTQLKQQQGMFNQLCKNGLLLSNENNNFINYSHNNIARKINSFTHMNINNNINNYSYKKTNDYNNKQDNNSRSTTSLLISDIDNNNINKYRNNYMKQKINNITNNNNDKTKSNIINNNDRTIKSKHIKIIESNNDQQLQYKNQLHLQQNKYSVNKQRNNKQHQNNYVKKINSQQKDNSYKIKSDYQQSNYNSTSSGGDAPFRTNGSDGLLVKNNNNNFNYLNNTNTNSNSNYHTIDGNNTNMNKTTTTNNTTTTTNNTTTTTNKLYNKITNFNNNRSYQTQQIPSQQQQQQYNSYDNDNIGSSNKCGMNGKKHYKSEENNNDNIINYNNNDEMNYCNNSVVGMMRCNLQQKQLHKNNMLSNNNTTTTNTTTPTINTTTPTINTTTPTINTTSTYYINNNNTTITNPNNYPITKRYNTIIFHYQPTNKFINQSIVDIKHQQRSKIIIKQQLPQQQPKIQCKVVQLKHLFVNQKNDEKNENNEQNDNDNNCIRNDDGNNPNYQGNENNNNHLLLGNYYQNNNNIINNNNNRQLMDE